MLLGADLHSGFFLGCHLPECAQGRVYEAQQNDDGEEVLNNKRERVHSVRGERETLHVKGGGQASTRIEDALRRQVIQGLQKHLVLKVEETLSHVT